MQQRRARSTWILSLVAAGGAALILIARLGPAVPPVSAALVSPLPSPTLPTLPPLSSPTLPPLPKPTVPAVLPTASAPVPLPTPSLPVSLPTPSLPVSLTPAPPTPTLPVGASPTPATTPTSGGAAPGSTGTSGGAGGGAGGGPGHGVTIPFTSIVLASPLDAALLGAIACLPLLAGIWLLVFGRTWSEARRSRDAQIRLAIAHDLGLSPRELASVTTKGLFKLREEAAFDELTGVLRRAAGIAALDREVARARRHKAPLAVAFLDVDGLKEANDTRGHKAGDQLLRDLADLLRTGLRGQDVVMRYGGDEFVCILPDTVADAARAKLSWIQTEAEKSGLRFSAGVAELERSDDVVSVLGRADKEMYAVKSRRGPVRDMRLGVVGPRREVAAPRAG